MSGSQPAYWALRVGEIGELAQVSGSGQAESARVNAMLSGARDTARTDIAISKPLTPPRVRCD
jgi:hypothetical protein